MAAFQIFYLLLFLFYKRCYGAINCSAISDCRTCTMSTDFLVPCKWCSSIRICTSSWTVGSTKDCSEANCISHSYNCPLTPPTKFGFLDDFARTRALPFIASASADTEPQIRSCLDNNIPSVTILNRYVIPCDFVKSQCVAFLAYSPTDNAIIITFRGTNGAVQVFVDALNFMIYVLKDFQPVGGKVISYFYDAFFQLWKNGLETDLREALKRHPNSELWACGSIGSLAASWISRLGIVQSDKIRFVSFGQPRTGNLAYAQIFDDLVWYNNDMLPGDAYEVCESADSYSCSATVNDSESISFTTNLNYYNVSLYSWYRSGCASKSHLKLRPRFPFDDASPIEENIS